MVAETTFDPQASTSWSLDKRFANFSKFETDLSTFVLDLMIHIMSYKVCLMHYLVSYVILSPYDLTALACALLLGPKLMISRLVSMHFSLCRCLRILEDMPFLSILRIRIPRGGPPHLTADPTGFRSN